MTTANISLTQIYAPIEKDLESFQNLLKHELKSGDELINNIHNHLLKMTGKFLRPAICLLSANLSDKKHPDAVKLAVAIELIHTATLVHDDIIDNSELRRNQPSIFSKWGREISIVSGDYLYAKSFLLLAGLKNIWINEAFATCAHVMCEGELKQIEKRNNFLMGEAEYLKIIHQKTAALFQAASAGGAYFAGLDDLKVAKLADYGFQLGMAFQIVDDLLDLVGQTESLGKTVGLDIYKNDVTLPILYLFQSLNEAQRAELFKEMQSSSDDPEFFQKIKNMALETKSVERAAKKAKDYIEKAVADLEPIPGSIQKESLTQLALYCVERVR